MCQIHTVLKSPGDFLTLSDYIAYLRKVREYTLQDVTELVADAINHKALPTRCSLTASYLSLLEAGKFDEPSPHKLRALAYVYSIPYEVLLQKAGYLPDKDLEDLIPAWKVSEVPELTPDERKFLTEFFALVKFKRTHHCGCNKQQK